MKSSVLTLLITILFETLPILPTNSSFNTNNRRPLVSKCRRPHRQTRNQCHDIVTFTPSLPVITALRPPHEGTYRPIFMKAHPNGAARKRWKGHRGVANRKRILRTMTTQVLRHGRIKTTERKAKEVIKKVDKMIALAKRQNVVAKKQILSYLYDKDLAHRVYHMVRHAHVGLKQTTAIGRRRRSSHIDMQALVDYA